MRQEVVNRKANGGNTPKIDQQIDTLEQTAETVAPKCPMHCIAAGRGSRRLRACGTLDLATLHRYLDFQASDFADAHVRHGPVDHLEL